MIVLVCRLDVLCIRPELLELGEGEKSDIAPRLEIELVGTVVHVWLGDWHQEDHLLVDNVVDSHVAVL